MTLQDFKIASFDKKCEWIVKHTDYLAAREDAAAKTYLYHTDKFFIEVTYSYKYKRVTSIKEFTDIDRLLVYSEEVSLAELFD